MRAIAPAGRGTEGRMNTTRKLTGRIEDGKFQVQVTYQITEEEKRKIISMISDTDSLQNVSYPLYRSLNNDSPYHSSFSDSYFISEPQQVETPTEDEKKFEKVTTDLVAQADEKIRQLREYKISKLIENGKEIFTRNEKGQFEKAI